MLRAVLPSGRQPSFVKHMVGTAGFEPAGEGKNVSGEKPRNALDHSAMFPFGAHPCPV